MALPAHSTDPSPAKSTPHFPDIGGAIALLFAVLLLDYGVAAGMPVIESWAGGPLPAAFTQGVANVITFGGVAWAGYQLTNRPIRAVFPFRTVPLCTVPGMALLMLGMSLVTLEGTALLTQVTPIPPWLTALLRDVTLGSGLIGLVFVAAVGPLVEELLFRGVILGGLHSHYQARWAIGTSAVLFGLVHLNPWQFVPAFGMGLATGWLFVRTRSLWPCVAFHGIYNAAFGFAAAPMLSALGLGDLAYATNGVLPLLPGWLVAGGIGLTALGTWLTHQTLPARPVSPVDSS